MTEEELIARFKKGDRSAFEQLVKAHQNSVFSVAFRLCQNTQDAEDAAQEAFIKLYKSLDSFRGQCSLSTYLYRIVSNVCLDMMRKRKETFSLTDEEGEDIAVCDESLNPEITVLKQEQKDLLERAVASLPYAYREMIVLREIKDFSYEEIAEITSLPLNTVRTRIARARARLKENLLKNGNFFEEFASNGLERGERNV